MPSDTLAALQANASNCESRSLLFDRFADPSAKEEARHNWFKQVIAKQPVTKRLDSWRSFTSSLGAMSGEPLYAQLQSRLMVNMAGGVMENAGLCLDRFGLPYIPGSAVKGCARRAALAALREWCETGQKPGATGQDQDNLFKTACAPFASPAVMLAAIAQVFGYGELDWKNNSDFAWACCDKWDQTRNEARALLGSARVSRAASGVSPDADAAPALPKDFAGSVAFLPAYPVDLGKTGKVDGLPVEVPPLGKLELDVVTCHHPDYYSSDDPNAVATDTEDPNPLVFPAVAPGHVFALALAPLRSLVGQASGLTVRGASGSAPGTASETPGTGGSETCPTTLARTWLKCGLETFGLGAKTAAGYGWFDASDNVQEAVIKALADAQKRRQQEQQRQREEARQKAEEAERQRKAAELKAATANMTPEEKADFEMCQCNDAQFRGRLESFLDRNAAEQQAIVRALRMAPETAGSRRQFWDDLKRKAQKGGKPARIEQAIRELSKKMFQGREGKMP